MNQIQFIFEFLSTVTKCDNDVLFRKMDDCDQAPQCAAQCTGGRSGGGELFHFPAWRNVAVTSWGQATVVLTIHWSPLNGAELHNSDTIAILQIHSKIQYLQLSPTAQHPAAIPAQPSPTNHKRGNPANPPNPANPTNDA